MSKDLEFLIKLVKDASLLITDDMHVKAKDDKVHIAANSNELLEILKENTYPNSDEKVEIIKIEN